MDSNTLTIVNTTVPGHVFYPGTVTIQVTPSAGGSQITITGSGTGDYPEFNDLVGELVFGRIAGDVANICDPSVGP